MRLWRDIFGNTGQHDLRKYKEQAVDWGGEGNGAPAGRKAGGGRRLDIDYSDIPKLTPEQLARMTRLRGPLRKVAVSVRLDPQAPDWLKSKGEGHLTRINDILTNLMEAERRAKAGRSDV
jgi:uncharacterized protein (DUF4415 family)